MKEYKHRESGHLVQADLRGSTDNKWYVVYDYPANISSVIVLTIGDFLKLFEPVESVSRHCCKTFDQMVDEGIFFTAAVSRWYLRGVNRSVEIFGCPFCFRPIHLMKKEP